MTYYTINNIEDLNKLKGIIRQKKDIKKLNLNTKIQKETQNYELAEQYAPITKLQEKQTEVIQKTNEDQIKAIENHTDTLKTLAAPMDDTADESTSSIEDDSRIKSINADISDALSTLTNGNTFSNFSFEKIDFNNYTVNGQPFSMIDDRISFDGKEYRITPSFIYLFIKGKSIDYKQFTQEEREALTDFIKYAGGLGKDRKSNLYNAYNYIINNVEGSGTSVVFLPSDPNLLVERLEVLVGESLAGNKNAYREASAILAELLRLEEITSNEYENIMNIFTK